MNIKHAKHKVLIKYLTCLLRNYELYIKANLKKDVFADDCRLIYLGLMILFCNSSSRDYIYFLMIQTEMRMPSEAFLVLCFKSTL